MSEDSESSSSDHSIEGSRETMEDKRKETPGSECVDVITLITTVQKQVGSPDVSRTLDYNTNSSK